MLIQLLPPLLIAIPITLGVYLATVEWVPHPTHQRYALAGLGVVAIGLYLLAAKLIVPLRFAEATDLLFSKLRRRSAP